MPLDESVARLLYFDDGCAYLPRSNLVKRINLNRDYRDTFLDRGVNCALRARMSSGF